MSRHERFPDAAPPLAGPRLTRLTVAGLNGSGPDHWQTLWERDREDCRRVPCDDWAEPVRRDWTAALDDAVRAAPGRVLLIAHSLGCLTVAWWAAAAPSLAKAKVAAALLVAPPDVAQQGADLRLLRFAPAPSAPLPFPATLVASRDDRYAALARSRDLAEAWGAAFVDAGEAGHINAESGLGDWPAGRALVAGLLHRR